MRQLILLLLLVTLIFRHGHCIILIQTPSSCCWGHILQLQLAFGH
jgi:hypothetical protein